VKIYNIYIMSIFKYINFPVFIISLAIGLFFVYVFDDDMRTIYVYPTPENADLIQYKDATDTCFSVKQTKVSCPSNSAEISKIPAQS
jgi:hypothetical protein